MKNQHKCEVTVRFQAFSITLEDIEPLGIAPDREVRREQLALAALESAMTRLTIIICHKKWPNQEKSE